MTSWILIQIVIQFDIAGLLIGWQKNRNQNTTCSSTNPICKKSEDAASWKKTPHPVTKVSQMGQAEDVFPLFFQLGVISAGLLI